MKVRESDYPVLRTIGGDGSEVVTVKGTVDYVRAIGATNYAPPLWNTYAERAFVRIAPAHEAQGCRTGSIAGLRKIFNDGSCTT
jgi:hypothetical protein